MTYIFSSAMSPSSVELAPSMSIGRRKSQGPPAGGSCSDIWGLSCKPSHPPKRPALEPAI